MSKHKEKSKDALKSEALAALDGKSIGQNSTPWGKFASFWYKNVESLAEAQRSKANQLTGTAIKVEKLLKKKPTGKQAEAEIARVLTGQTSLDSEAIVSRALKKIGTSAGKEGKMLSFPGKKTVILAGGGILATAAIALFVILMRPTMQYTPVTPGQMQTALSILPEAQDGMGLLEERDSAEVAAFVYGFYIELAKSFPLEPPSREFPQLLAKFADALQRRGFTAEAAIVNSLVESARVRSLTGSDLIARLNTLHSQLVRQIRAEDMYWYDSGAWSAKKLVKEFGMGRWDEVEENGLDKVRKELEKKQPRTEKLQRVQKALAIVFRKEPTPTPPERREEKKEILGDTLENMGIFRF